MYLIIALLIGAVIGVKYFGEKKSRKEIQREFEWKHAEASVDAEKFFAKYAASEDLEASMKRKVFRDDPDVVELKKRISIEADVNPTYDMLFYALVAQRGKIPRRAAREGFKTTPGRSSSEPAKPYLEIERRFMIWYDELRRHGVSERLLFLRYDDKRDFFGGYKYHLAKWVQTAGDAVTGNYLWLPTRKFANIGGNMLVV